MRIIEFIDQVKNARLSDRVLIWFDGEYFEIHHVATEYSEGNLIIYAANVATNGKRYQIEEKNECEQKQMA